ncbi:hypothetical protein [Anaeromyxobacter paludicola]|uniref:Prepilin-type N-terminal cleavage/methylation domain-containing protein n=1 Tax=Anaeromyxobacter paludicola TaxID=2918171 RepID=A0ABM7XB45_9BACT|nr:hypothetical protein [Anaeromyxobacter paludicola]BDG09040.1 hypothetical protein AMPC_21530 [Anaeromyxobacter paludicola]
MNRPAARSARGFTVTEVLVAGAIAAIIVALSTRAIVKTDHDQFLRKTVTDVQGSTRVALEVVAQDLRAASLGAGTGVVWTASGSNPAGRPAVQIFTAVPGGGKLDVKPGTDALLVVAAQPGPTAARTATVNTLTDSTQAITVTDSSAFSAGTPVLLGDYGDASWGVVATASPGGSTLQQLTLANSSVNVFPSQQMRQMGQGASVRAARAHLYYVDANDELVQLTLSVPRAPADYSEATARVVLARGVENMQLDCQLDNGMGAFQGCPAPLTADPSPFDPLLTESTAAFGSFGSGQGPRITTAVTSTSRVGLLRNVIVNVAARSTHPVDPGQGDPKIALGSGQVVLPVGGASDSAAYVRRAYQLVASPRNTALGAF